MPLLALPQTWVLIGDGSSITTKLGTLFGMVAAMACLEDLKALVVPPSRCMLMGLLFR
jgi:hypothetical protein